MREKISFPSPGWYSRGFKNTLFKWDGKNWTGETNLIIGGSKEEHLAEVALCSPAKISVKRKFEIAYKKMVPFLLVSSGIAAALIYQSTKNKK